jgi:SAM-dependent methyltransferase
MQSFLITVAHAQKKAREMIALANVQKKAENNSVQQDVFEKIYEDNVWGSSESFSGTGSELAQTEVVRACLGKWIEKYSVTALLDIPCGDANWQSHIPGIEDVEYYGYDISARAIDLAREKNKDSANMHFDLLDLSESDPPATGDSRVVNMVVVKEVLQHVPLEMGVQMLRHAKAAGIKWLAVTTVAGGKNIDVEIGGWFGPPDVQAPPYNFPKAQEICETYNDHEKMRLFYLKDWDGNR